MNAMLYCTVYPLIVTPHFIGKCSGNIIAHTELMRRRSKVNVQPITNGLNLPKESIRTNNVRQSAHYKKLEEGEPSNTFIWQYTFLEASLAKAVLKLSRNTIPYQIWQRKLKTRLMRGLKHHRAMKNKP